MKATLKGLSLFSCPSTNRTSRNRNRYIFLSKKRCNEEIVELKVFLQKGFCNKVDLVDEKE